ncbi:MAG TPA: DapH/DapD/GlmU-related protein [Desulforhopalus sp.]|nr:DapH/DapD/GlmU-related protein [Desulforhopalus sp.]
MRKNEPLQSRILPESSFIAATAEVSACCLGRYCEVADGAKLAESTLGDYSYVMERCDIMSSTIGKFANIAAEVRLNPGNHPMEWVSQHHFLYRRRLYGLHQEDLHDFFDWRRRQRVVVGHDTWIGHRAIVMPGVTIHNGAVVGAGSIVTRDVAPYQIVAGVPARPIRARFPEAIWRCLEAIGWWDWDHQTLAERLEDFYDIRRFIARYGENR